MTTAELVALIKQVRRKPIERDTLYNEIRDYTDVDIRDIEQNPILN